MDIVDELVNEFHNGGIKNERLKGLTEGQLKELVSRTAKGGTAIKAATFSCLKKISEVL